MARVTVEDCIEKISNRFELIIAASQRAREISNGVALEVDRDNDKNPVVSLREIAEGAVTPTDLHERFIRTLQKVNYTKNPDDDDETSIEEEFSAYLNNTTLSSDNEVTNQVNFSSHRGEEEVFEDVSQEVVKNEE
mgnify:FL=1